MAPETPDSDEVTAADAVRALRVAGIETVAGAPPPAPDAVTAVGDGVNDVFVVPVADDRFVVKFGTYSTAAHLRAGVVAARVLGLHTDLPVPSVYGFAEDPDGLPPFVVQQWLPGDPLAADFDDPRATAPAAVGLLGAVLRGFAGVPREATAGYGPIESLERRGLGPCAVAEYDDCASWLVAYGTRFLADPPEHVALAEVAPRAADHLRSNRDRLPPSPAPSVVLTDCSPGNLLAPGGTPPTADDGTPDPGGLTGVVDLERAKIGPAEFAAVNAEYLLTRDLDDPAPVREALYDPLPFGPDVPFRDCYRIVAMARSVAALPAWYDPGSERFRERGDAVAAELERIVG